MCKEVSKEDPRRRVIFGGSPSMVPEGELVRKNTLGIFPFTRNSAHVKAQVQALKEAAIAYVREYGGADTGSSSEGDVSPNCRRQGRQQE